MASWLAVMLTISGLTWLYYECMIRLLIPWAQLGDQYYLLYYLFIYFQTNAYVLGSISLIKMTSVGPGFAPPDYHPEQGDIDPLTEDFSIQSCNQCRAWKPPRSVHCRRCGRCVLKHEFHFWQYDVCVGYLNYKYYVLFMWNVSCLAFNTNALMTYWFIINVFWTGDRWIDVVARTPECLWMAIVCTLSFWLSVYCTVMHAQCWGAFLSNTTNSELRLYRKYMTRRTRAEKKALQKMQAARDVGIADWNQGHPMLKQALPVWPYSLGEYKNVLEVLGPFWWWMIPTGPPKWTNGLRFPISPEWYSRNLPEEERSQYVYPLSPPIEEHSLSLQSSSSAASSSSSSSSSDSSAFRATGVLDAV